MLPCQRIWPTFYVIVGIPLGIVLIARPYVVTSQTGFISSEPNLALGNCFVGLAMAEVAMSIGLCNKRELIPG